MSVLSVTREKKRAFHLKRCFSFLHDKNSGFYYFLVLLLVGVLFFATSLFTNYFTTPLTGDYTIQQYAFYTNGYDDWWHFFKTGEFVLYDTNTFLGVSNIGSNSFYYLFDPFFLPILIFPRELIPQGIAIMTIFKMAFAGLVFSFYMNYLGVKRFTARLAGLMYAFCGWTTWYLWFNHFTGVALIFPLILLGVEKVLNEKKPWLLSGSLFILGLTNFFFFFTFTICAFLYAMFRYLQRIKTYTKKEAFTVLGIGFFGFLIGCLLATVVVIPSMMVALTAPRATESTYLPSLIESLKAGDILAFLKGIFSWEAESTPYKVYYPILDFIFPVMSDRGTPLTKLGSESYDNVAGSLFCYSPVIIFLIPALISSFKRKHYSPLIVTGLFLLMLFTPFCYYAFHGFTYAYSRWTLFVTTSLISYVAFYIDRIDKEPSWHTLLGGAFAFVMCWVSIIIAIHISRTYDDFKLRYIYSQLGTYGFVIIEGVLFSAYVMVLTLFIYCYHDKTKLKAIFTFAVMIEAVIMGALTLNGHGYEGYLSVNGGYSNNKAFQSLIDDIKKDDPTYYRCYSSQEVASSRNDSMRHDYNGLGMFHSLYNYNLAPFLNWSQINDYTAPSSYSASYVEKRQDLDTFLGVKYYFVHKDKAFYGDEEAEALKADNYRINVPLGFKDISSRYPNDYCYVFENENFIDFAFSYDKIAFYDNVDDKGNISEPERLFSRTYENDELYLKTAIIGESDLDKVRSYFSEEDIKQYQSYRSLIDSKKVPTSAYEVTYYDIHHDSEKNRLLASDVNFVSKLLDLSSYEAKATKPAESKYDARYVTVFNLNDTFPYDENGLVLYFKNSYLRESNINVYLVSKDSEGHERFLTYDNHNDNGIAINWTLRKNWRAFYSAPSYDENGNFIPASKLSKIIVVSRKTKLEEYELAYKTGTDVKNTIAELKENPVTDINHSTNHSDFKTNYNLKRVVVTQLAYEEGWSLKATLANGETKNLDVFKGQGGFVSFVAEAGNVSYSLDYYTPYLKLSSYISGIAVFIYLGSQAAYLYLSMSWNDQNIVKDAEFKRKTTRNKIF